ncbi:MAG: glycerol kinase GlpK [Syntrophomonadaceae bacterium]|jgi:glycerol kinase
MDKRYVMALDEGTTGARAIIFDENGHIVSDAAQEFTQIYPQPGWVEHNPLEILNTQLDMARKAIAKANISPEEIRAIGITNQRETTVIWEKATGKPVYNAIVWGSSQSTPFSEKWAAEGLEQEIRDKTGLFCSPSFSATKIAWILANVPGAREKAEKGELLFGNIDSWLIWNLTGGKSHVTDYSNASRTMIFNIHTLTWDEELCSKFGIPMSLLPKPLPCNANFGTVEKEKLGAEIPVHGVAGDQQSALFGQACFTPGMAKMTYGTAGIFMINTGNQPVYSDGLLTTVAWGLDGQVSYAVEGYVLYSGATIQWLRDGAHFIFNAADSEWYGNMVEDTEGVYLVPGFSGLGAPYWDAYARGIIVGITRGTSRDHIIRAGLDALSYQTRDIVECLGGAMEIPELRIDGGAIKNNLLCQFQADILGIPVVRPTVIEMTAQGAAFLAGLGSGLWKDFDDITKRWEIDKTFKPSMTEERRNNLYKGWRSAVELSLGWAKKVTL